MCILTNLVLLRKSCFLIIFLCCHAFIYGQHTQQYTLDISSDSNDLVEIIFQPMTMLSDAEIYFDTITLFPDTSYINRHIHFNVNGSQCEDIIFGLQNLSRSKTYGFRFVDNKILILHDRLMLQGPFDGSGMNGLPVIIPDDIASVQELAIVCDANTLEYYINDTLIYSSCTKLDTKYLIQSVIPIQGVQLIMSTDYVEY